MAVFGTIHNVRISGIACAVPEKVVGNDFKLHEINGSLEFTSHHIAQAAGVDLARPAPVVSHQVLSNSLMHNEIGRHFKRRMLLRLLWKIV